MRSWFQNIILPGLWLLWLSLGVVQGQTGLEPPAQQTIDDSLRQQIAETKLNMLFEGTRVSEADQGHDEFSRKLRELI